MPLFRTEPVLPNSVSQLESPDEYYLEYMRKRVKVRLFAMPEETALVSDTLWTYGLQGGRGQGPALQSHNDVLVYVFNKFRYSWGSTVNLIPGYVAQDINYIYLHAPASSEGGAIEAAIRADPSIGPAMHLKMQADAQLRAQQARGLYPRSDPDGSLISVVLTCGQLMQVHL